MTTPDPGTDAITEARAEWHKALGALRYEVSQEIVADVAQRAERYFAALSADERRAVLAECVCGHAESEHDPYPVCSACDAASQRNKEHAYESREAALTRLPETDAQFAAFLRKFNENAARVEKLEAALRRFMRFEDEVWEDWLENDWKGAPARWLLARAAFADVPAGDAEGA